MNFNFKPSSYAINSRTLKLVQLLYTVQTRRNILKLSRNSHNHLTETPSFAWYVAAALKPLPQFASVHTNNGLIVPLFLLTKTNPAAPRYLSYLQSKRILIIESSFHHEHEYYHKNKACCILMGIKNLAKKLVFYCFLC